MGELNKKDGNPYTIFTPFKNNGLGKKIDKVKKTKVWNLVKTNKLSNIQSDYIKYEINKNLVKT